MHPKESFAVLMRVMEEGLSVPLRMGAHVLGLLKDLLESRAEGGAAKGVDGNGYPRVIALVGRLATRGLLGYLARIGLDTAASVVEALQRMWPAMETEERAMALGSLCRIVLDSPASEEICKRDLVQTVSEAAELTRKERVCVGILGAKAVVDSTKKTEVEAILAIVEKTFKETNQGLDKFLGLMEKLCMYIMRKKHYIADPIIDLQSQPDMHIQSDIMFKTALEELISTPLDILEQESSSIDPEVLLLVPKILEMFYFKCQLYIGKQETKYIVDLLERIRQVIPKITQNPNYERELVQSMASILNLASYVLPVRNYILTRESTVKIIINDILHTANYVSNQLTKIDISEEVESLRGMNALNDKIDLSGIIVSPTYDELRKMDQASFFRYELTRYVFSLPSPPRTAEADKPGEKTQEKLPMISNVNLLLEAWKKHNPGLTIHGNDPANANGGDSRMSHGGIRQRKDSSRKINKTFDGNEQLESSLNPGAQHATAPANTKEDENLVALLSWLNLVSMYFTRNEIHRELNTLRTLTMLIGNCCNQRHHRAVLKNFYQPKLIEMLNAAKSEWNPCVSETTEHTSQYTPQNKPN